MLKIKPIRALLGKSVTAKLKNTKDDQERVIEFSLSQLSLTLQQLSDLVACSKHERNFSQVAFVSEDAVSELRHFKKMELATEVYEALMTLAPVGSSSNKMKLHSCSLKSISLTFKGSEKCEMSCKVWAPIEEHALYTLSGWGSQDLYVGIESKNHGAEETSPNNVLDLPTR